ncbi:hypothetical protein Q8W71_28380 [Methylobacterium sp. NEAU 140]|uniref:hypothetical protein n=1 Tax=Methylobacterium sp. NEAU 140 TaxID=3064945 RepID=UPI002733338B|nr:hypothetical protein [Methylobacterium sp. NEAU 140]MDP4026538.1 hypothetical protein [Methylobacterium sp. NEAU 140]
MADTPHILRDTVATRAGMDGVPFGKMARALGTTERIVEDVDGRHAPEHLRDVVEGRELAAGLSSGRHAGPMAAPDS